MPGAKPIAVLLAALGLAACAQSETPLALQSTGSVTGGIGGAGSARSSVGVAGVLGNGIGVALDDRDRQRALAAELQALDQGEPGEPVGWRGAAGRYGTVVPGAYYETRGTRCRDYSHTIFIDGRPQTARATACRGPDGAWTPVA